MSAAVTLERQIRPIYGWSQASPFFGITANQSTTSIAEALDTGSNKSAIVSCNKLLKKYPNNLLVKACRIPLRDNFPLTCLHNQSLKALALVRSQKVEESLALCDEVLAVKPLDDPTISAMMHVLKGLGRSRPLILAGFTVLITVPSHRHGQYV